MPPRPRSGPMRYCRTWAPSSKWEGMDAVIAVLVAYGAAGLQTDGARGDVRQSGRPFPLIPRRRPEPVVHLFLEGRHDVIGFRPLAAVARFGDPGVERRPQA